MSACGSRAINGYSYKYFDTHLNGYLGSSAELLAAVAEEIGFDHGLFDAIYLPLIGRFTTTIITKFLWGFVLV